MPSQSVRRAARRAALDAQTRVRRREEEHDKRRSRLGDIIVTALAEGDAQVELWPGCGDSMHARVGEPIPVGGQRYCTYVARGRKRRTP